MKRHHRLLAMGGALVVFGLAAFGLSKIEVAPTATLEEETTLEPIFTMEASDVSALSWTYNDETVSIAQDENGWYYAGDESFPMDDTLITIMLADLSSITPEKVIAKVDSLSEYGLLEPTCTIQVTTDTEAEIIIGDETAMGGQRYCSIGDGNVYLVNSNLLSDFSYGLYDLVAMEEIPYITDPRVVTIETKDNSLEFDYLTDSGIAYSNSYVWFYQENGDYTTLDTELTESYLSTVTAMNWLSCENYHASEDELNGYGLSSPAMTITIHYTEDDSDEVFVLELGDYSGSSCYAKLKDSSMVYLVDAAIRDDFSHFSVDSLLPDEILLLDESKILSVDVVTPQGSGVFVRNTRTVTEASEDSSVESTEYEETYYTIGDKETAFGDSVDTLLGLYSAGTATDTNYSGDPKLSFTFHMDSETHDTVTLEFYAYDSSTDLVVLNGEARLLAYEDNVLSLVEAIEDDFISG